MPSWSDRGRRSGCNCEKFDSLGWPSTFTEAQRFQLAVHPLAWGGGNLGELNRTA